MIVEIGRRAAPVDFPTTVVCIGTFDGVHLGHQEVIRQTVKVAAELEAVPALATFDRNPLEVVAPDRAPQAITRWSETVELAAALGIAFARVIPFDEALRAMPAEEFLKTVIQNSFHARQVVVGYDFAMGKDRIGTAEWLAERIETKIIPPYLLDGERVSSSSIRRLIGEGDLEAANRHLGRAYFIDAVVGKGDQIGRTLGFPTLNLFQPAEVLTPAEGVYGGWAEVPGGTYLAAISIGRRETLGEGPRLVEAYLLDYPGESLYGKPVRLSFCERIRGQAKFANLDELRAQMAVDVERIREALPSAKPECHPGPCL